MTLVIVALLVEILKLINLLLEGVPIEQRRAQSILWFWATWPALKTILKLGKVPDEALTQAEELMKDVKP